MESADRSAESRSPSRTFCCPESSAAREGSLTETASLRQS